MGWKSFLTLLPLVASIGLQACSIQRPGVKDASRKIATFKHTGTESSCTECHEADRPAPIAGVEHGNGGDCVACHQAGTSWGGGVTSFNHSPMPATCSNCHENRRPTVVVNNFSHTLHGMGDCVRCHAAVPANAGVSWAGGNYDHMDANGVVVKSCSECHESKRPAVLVNGFDHQTPSVRAQDCATCHRNAGVNWTGGQFNHSPTPTSCNSCHAGSRPAPMVAVPAPSNLVPRPNQMLHSALYQGTNDCVGCHANTPANLANLGTSFAGGTFDHMEISNGAKVSVTSCKGCHELQRPSVPSVNGFSHQKAGIGTLDCFGCHRSAGLNWSNQTYNHSPAPTSCNTCHASTRPAANVALPNAQSPDQYFHAARFLGEAQCNTCHARYPTQANLATTFAGGTYSHKELVNGQQVNVTTCMECHERKRPANHYVGQNCVNCHNVAGHVGIDWKGATGMPHPVSGATTGSTLNCVSCHGNTGTASTKLTVAASAHMGGTANTCISCHKNYAGFSGSTTNVQYAHNYGTGLNTPDCKTCHNFVGGVYRSYTNSTWSLSQSTTFTATGEGETFTRNHTVSATDQNMSNCLACHRYAAPSGTQTPSQRWSFRHNAPNMTQTQARGRLGCAVCHEHK